MFSQWIDVVHGPLVVFCFVLFFVLYFVLFCFCFVFCFRFISFFLKLHLFTPGQMYGGQSKGVRRESGGEWTENEKSEGEMQHCVTYKLNIPYIYDNDFNYGNCVRNLQTHCAFSPLELILTSITSFQIYILLYTAKILTCLLLEFYICIYRKSHKKSLFSFVGPYLGIIKYDTIFLDVYGCHMIKSSIKQSGMPA